MINLRVKYIYLILCFLGLILPYSQLILILIEGNLGFEMMVTQLFGNRVSALFALDLFVTATVFVVFAINEGFKLKIKNVWIPLLATIVVGASLGFPLFLYLREINLEKKLVKK